MTFIHQCPTLDRAAPSSRERLSLRDGCFAQRLFHREEWSRGSATPKPRPSQYRPLATSRPVYDGPKGRQRPRQARPSAPSAILVAQSSTRCPDRLASTGSHYRSNIYSLAPGRDVVARGSTSLFAGMPSPRGPKSRGRFFRRVERGRGHSGKKPGKHSPERPQELTSTKSYQPFNPPRIPSRPGAALVCPPHSFPANSRPGYLPRNLF